MRRLFRFVIGILFLYMAWSFIKEEVNLSSPLSMIKDLKDEVVTVMENGEVEEAIQVLLSAVVSFVDMLDQTIDLKESPSLDKESIERPLLNTPDNHTFSIHNIEMDDDKTDVEKILGTPKRASYNEYGTEWFTYHENYQNFIKVMYDKNEKVVGLYTNQDMISSTVGIKLGVQKAFVQEQLGSPLSKIQKGFVFYQIQADADYDVYQIDESYVTIFYDKHEENTVTAIQMVHKDIEQSKTDFYTEASDKLKEGFEYQMFDLINASRVLHGLSVLSWDDHVRETARKHSLDMAQNHYFDHTNLEGESPFDRMKEDDLFFTLAGENLAYGQFSSIFAHEGLMNSLGHRENILQSDFEYVGVGVAFNSESHPYYTQNFYAK